MIIKLAIRSEYTCMSVGIFKEALKRQTMFTAADGIVRV